MGLIKDTKLSRQKICLKIMNVNLFKTNMLSGIYGCMKVLKGPLLLLRGPGMRYQNCPIGAYFFL